MSQALHRSGGPEIPDIPVRGAFDALLRNAVGDNRAELPLDYAIQARLTAERLYQLGYGLDAVLESVIDSASRAGASWDIGGDMLLKVAQAYIETSFGDYLEQERWMKAEVAIARAVGTTLDPGEIAKRGLDETLEALQLEAGAIWLVIPGTPGIRLAHATGLSDEELAALQVRDLTKSGPISEAIADAAPAQFRVRATIPGLDKLANALVVPLIGPDGLLGLIGVGSREPRVFTESELNIAVAGGEHITAALDQAHHHRVEALTDHLTGLANRKGFDLAMQREMNKGRRRKKCLSILLVDLDRLKSVNDEHGHAVGDRAIRAVADVLRRAIRTSDVPGRIGGDEFAVALADADIEQARAIASRVRTGLADLNETGALPTRIGLSIGLAEWGPGMTYADLIDAADEGLYDEKKAHHAVRSS